MDTSVVPSGLVARKTGITVGLVLGVIQIVFGLLSAYAGLSFLAPGSLICMLVWALAFLYTGYKASQQTGRAGTGALAGLWTALIAGIISFAYEIILFLVNRDAVRQALQTSLNNSGLNMTIDNATAATYVIIGYLVLFALGIGFGAAFGALGGLIGRGRANRVYTQDTPPAQTV